MSDESQGPGWWIASDGKWYPPELHPNAQAQQPAQPTQPMYTPPGGPGFPSATGQLDVGPALSYGWRKFSQNAGPLLAIVLIPVAVQFVLSFVGRTVFSSAAGGLVIIIISEIIGLALSIGIINAALMASSGAPVDVAGAFRSDRWGEWIAFAFVWGLMVGIGAIFCGIGALVVIGIWGFAPFYFIDQNMSLGESLRASSQTTGANSGLRVTLAVVALVGFLGVILCGVGLLVTMPMGYVGAAYLYRTANHQTVAA
jgi:uncharacterized membrane protein